MLIYNYNYPCVPNKSDSVKEMGYIYSHINVWFLASKPKSLCDCDS